jgi:uncharacterized protein (DUF2141 family)
MAMTGTRRITARKTWRFVTLLGSIVAIAILPPLSAAAPGLGTIDVHIDKLRNNHGQVICTLFTPTDQFPDRSHKGMTMAVPIRNEHATCHFKNVRYGNYAIVAFHDENQDGEFNQNWLGLPKEGFGFSDNPGTLKKPNFSDAKFIVEQPVVDVTIMLNYWF